MTDVTPGRLPAILSVLSKAVKCVAAKEADDALRFSCRRLQASLMLAQRELERVLPHIDHTHPLLEALKKSLESLVAPSFVTDCSATAVSSCDLLDEVCTQCLATDNLTQTAVRQWIDISSVPVNQQVEATLCDLVDRLQMEYPDGGLEISDEFKPHKRRRAEPPYIVSKAAQSVFQALLSGKGCTCDPPHTYDARLGLATYRDPSFAGGNFEFNVLLALEQIWHEIKIGTETEVIATASKVRFSLNDDPASVPAVQKRKEIKYLCKPIKSIRKQPQWRTFYLDFVVDRGSLWYRQRGKSPLPMDLVETTVSLEDFIRTRGSALTEKTKRILAVLLSHAVLHLHGTPWMRHDWGPTNVEFLQVSPSIIPLKPYIQIQLSENCAIHKPEPDNDEASSDDEDFFADDDDFCHPYPHFVTLGMMLMQVYLARTYQSLAEEFDVDDVESLDNNHKFGIAAQVFEKYSAVIKFSEKYWSAINRCLDPFIQVDDRGNSLDDDALRKVIYDDIISPLEDELTQGNFSTDDLVLNLDVEAQNLDLANLGQPIRFELNPQSQRREPSRSPSPAHKTKSHSLGLPLFAHSSKSPPPQEVSSSQETPMSRRGKHVRAGCWRQENVIPSHVAGICRSTNHGITFFDDERRQEAISVKVRDGFFSWEERILEVYDEFLDPAAKNANVKVAVLDTGIDLDHPDLIFNRERRKRIRECIDFAVDSDEIPGKDARDKDGHGTHIAGLLLDFAPGANLYVAKIVNPKTSLCASIAKAIMYAVGTWQVDIISLSFGFTSRNEPDYRLLEDAIEHAAARHVLVFAAASNDGANQQRAFPARHSSVLCIHSTDTAGNPSDFNPPPERVDNFATLGMYRVEIGHFVRDPVAVGIASFLLQYGRENLSEADAALMRRPNGMRAALKEISMESKGFDYLAPRLHPEHLFGMEKEYVKRRLGVVLRKS